MRYLSIDLLTVLRQVFTSDGVGIGVVRVLTTTEIPSTETKQTCLRERPSHRSMNVGKPKLNRSSINQYTFNNTATFSRQKFTRVCYPQAKLNEILFYIQPHPQEKSILSRERPDFRRHAILDSLPRSRF